VAFQELTNKCRTWWAHIEQECRVAKCHGVDGYIRAKILASWAKSLGGHTILQNEDFFGGDLNYPTLTESSTSVLQKYPYCQFCSIWVPKLVFLRVNFGFKVCDSATLQECGKHRILEMQINLTKCSDKATAGFWILLEEALFSFLAAQCTAFSRLLPLLLLLLLFHTSNRNNRVNLFFDLPNSALDPLDLLHHHPHRLVH